jgi:hypothetical protein
LQFVDSDPVLDILSLLATALAIQLTMRDFISPFFSASDHETSLARLG